LEGLALEDVGIFYGHFVHFTVFCYISWTFGKVCGNLVYFSRFGFCTKKNLATLRLTGGKKQITQVSKKKLFYRNLFKANNTSFKLSHSFHSLSASGETVRSRC
jgi:hypothetical protein